MMMVEEGNGETRWRGVRVWSIGNGLEVDEGGGGLAVFMTAH